MYLNPLKNLINALFYPVRFYVEDGEGGGGDAGAAGGEGGAAGGDAGGEGGTAMPEGLPESFWDADKGEVKLETFIKSFNDTKAFASKKEEEVRAKVIADQQAARPEDPLKYEVSELGIELPEGISIEFRDNDTFLRTWRKIAFQSNLSQDQFMEGVRDYVKDTLEDRIDINAEREKLGENAQDRIDRIDMLMNKHLTDEQAELFAESIMSAAGIEAMEALISGIGGSRIPDIDTMQQTGKLTKEDIQEMMKDERYWKKGDPAYHKKVADAWARLAAQEKKKRA